MAEILHSSASGTQLHEAKRHKEPVRAASTVSINISAPGATMDGVTLSTGDRVLLKDQAILPDNGIYMWMGAATPMARAADALITTDFTTMFIVGVREGTANGGSHWLFTTDTNGFTLNIDDVEFANLVSSFFADEVQAVDFRPTGLTGAVNASRYVGAVNGSPPTTGSFLVGDYVVDRTIGGMWVCITSGTPGTWRPTGSPADVAAARLFLASNYS